MSVIISPIITNAGLGVFTPMTTGIEFTFTHVAVGTGTSAVTAAATALENEIARFPIVGGGIVTGGQAVSINALITNHANANPQNYDITELGFYGVDGASNTVLFAIYRQNTPLISKVSGADIAAPFVLGLAALPVNNMTVQIDTNTSQTLALMGQHTAANHPHTQYKRTLDNTERLKIATAVDADEAIRKDELDALRVRLIANGIDADLAVTNVITSDIDTLGTTQRGWLSGTTPNRPFNHCIFDVVSLTSTDAIQIAKNSGQEAYRYGVGGVDHAGHTWSDWTYRANRNGDSNQVFSVKTATSDNHAPTYKQLLDGLDAVAGNVPSISGKADLAGNSSQLFSAADGTTGKEVVNFDQLTAMLNRVWPIGSIYENSISSLNPSNQSLLGFGTWVATQAGRVSVGYQAGDSLFGAVGNEGGARSHKMTLANLIEHDHDYTDRTELDYAASNSVGLGTDHKDRVLKTGKAGSADPEAIPTLPPYHVSYKWIRIA
jgi:hypothetical protein